MASGSGSFLAEGIELQFAYWLSLGLRARMSRLEQYRHGRQEVDYRLQRRSGTTFIQLYYRSGVTMVHWTSVDGT